ncbi:membrane hypothetical protein [Syntrophobacter sp. SbD1]|nr:membrane hypothetical protein [Syntrophobacter sp. SbD1]
MRLSLRKRRWIVRSIVALALCFFVFWYYGNSTHTTHGISAPGKFYNGWYSSTCYSGPWLLDVLFGIPYGIVNSMGLWHAGPSWLKVTHPLLGLLCYFVWPTVVTLLLGLVSVVTFDTLWGRRSLPFRALAVVIPLALLAGLLLPHGQLEVSHYSYWKYSFANW